MSVEQEIIQETRATEEEKWMFKNMTISWKTTVTALLAVVPYILNYVGAMHDWIRAASACLEAHKPVAFYRALNKFLAGK